MHIKRKMTLKTLMKRETFHKSIELQRKEYAEDVLTSEKLLRKLPNRLQEEFKELLENNGRISDEAADFIANIMKEWALSKNVYHYTHWFQPLHGEIAEKTSNFLIISGKSKVNVLCKDTLIKQETDGSSFPNGGLRSTFEARGYIIWDPKSPAFILNNSLCIPSLLISYKEEALDFKTPLLRAVEFVENAALKLTKLLIPETKYVRSLLGWEQEFFIFDKSILQARKDIEIAGRALIGLTDVKNHTHINHYFGKIPPRVLNFMEEAEKKSYELGIPIKTRHNEVAPNQFEFSYFFAETSLAIDHNQLFMEIMKQIATKHDLTVNFHEKPFRTFNGSGKHCNFSFQTDRGLNLYKRSGNFTENLLFLSMLAATISGIYKNGHILNASIASYENDLRLGGHEAPPNILSVFIVDDLHDFLVNKIQKSDKKLFTSTTCLPDILLDTHDRNRTSPFAYNGNRFEFRSVGSSVNCAEAMIALYTILGDEMNQMYEDITRKSEKLGLEESVLHAINEKIQTSQPILFKGDGYSADWVQEAKNRGLACFENCPDCIQKVLEDEQIQIYCRNGIFTPDEIKARYDVKLRKYKNKLKIETVILLEFVQQNILPVSEKYLYRLRKQNGKINCDDSRVENIQQLINELKTYSNQLANSQEFPQEQIETQESAVKLLQKIQSVCEKIEFFIPDKKWDILKNDELLHL